MCEPFDENGGFVEIRIYVQTPSTIAGSLRKGAERQERRVARRILTSLMPEGFCLVRAV